jgi:hypothetical protein
MTQVVRGEREQQELTANLRALLKMEDRQSAANTALRLKQAEARLAEDRKQLEDAERTYSGLVHTRDTAVAETRNKIELLRHEIGELKVKRAVADLESMAVALISDLGGAGDSFNRLQEMVSEEREKASARARVAGGNLDASDLAMKEAEQQALAEQALEEFLASERTDDPVPPLALPDLTENLEPAPLKRPRENGRRR